MAQLLVSGAEKKSLPCKGIFDSVSGDSDYALNQRGESGPRDLERAFIRLEETLLDEGEAPAGAMT